VNKAKKSGEVEKISLFKRNMANFLAKLVMSVKTEKQDFCHCKISERNIERRDFFLQLLFLFITT